MKREGGLRQTGGSASRSCQSRFTPKQREGPRKSSSPPSSLILQPKPRRDSPRRVNQAARALPRDSSPPLIRDPLLAHLPQHSLVKPDFSLDSSLGLFADARVEAVAPPDELDSWVLLGERGGDFGDWGGVVRVVEDETGPGNVDAVCETLAGQVIVDEGGNAVRQSYTMSTSSRSRKRRSRKEVFERTCQQRDKRARRSGTPACWACTGRWSRLA